MGGYKKNGMGYIITLRWRISIGGCIGKNRADKKFRRLVITIRWWRFYTFINGDYHFTFYKRSNEQYCAGNRFLARCMQSRRCCWYESAGPWYRYDVSSELCKHDANGYSTQCDRICKRPYKNKRNDESRFCNKSCCHCFNSTLLLVLITVVN